MKIFDPPQLFDLVLEEAFYGRGYVHHETSLNRVFGWARPWAVNMVHFPRIPCYDSSWFKKLVFAFDWYAIRAPSGGMDLEGHAMTMKEEMLEALRELAEDATIEDAMERLLFPAKAQRGIQQADAGQTLSHGMVRDWVARRMI